MSENPRSDTPWTNGVPGVDDRFVVTIEADPWNTGQKTEYEAEFTWDGEASHANFVWDISRYQSDLSSGSSSPAPGWISWIVDGKLAVAVEHTELDAAAAKLISTSDLDTSDLSAPAPWARMLDAITHFITETL